MGGKVEANHDVARTDGRSGGHFQHGVKHVAYGLSPGHEQC